MSSSKPRQDGPAWGDRSKMAVLNHDIRRIDGPDKVSGRATYTHDVRLPGMLWGRVLLCPYPAARVVSMDLGAARKIEGVRVALQLEDERTGYLGQPVAAVAAMTPELAEDAIRAIRVEYEEMDWCVTREQSAAEDAPQIRQGGNVSRAQEEGDAAEAEAAFGECDAIVEATYTLPVQHHASLETHGVVVDYRGGDEATVWASTQGTFSVPGEAARMLGLEANKVVCRVEHMGGGFGAKFGLDLPGQIACRLALEAKAPVHLMFTRKDEFLSAGNRSGSHQVLKGGATSDGRFRAYVADVTRLGGIGRGSFPGGRPYIYSPEHLSYHMRVRSVFTNMDSSRAMRAPGHPQASFGIESLVDELAYAIGMDPLEFRKKNLPDPVYHRQLDRVAQGIGWAQHPNKTAPGSHKRALAEGIGFGVSTWGGGGREGNEVEVRIDKEGGVTALVGSQDLGTGTRTLIAGIVAEELGLPASAIVVHIGDSRLGNANGSGGSVTAASLSPAVKDAAYKAASKLFAKVAPVLETDASRLKARGGAVFDSQDEGRRIEWKRACAALGVEGITAHGEFQEHLASNGVHGAQAVRVQVNTVTGAIRVLKMVCMQDVGLPINRLALRSQINGGMLQAMSYGLFEERVLDPWLGTMLNAGFEDYKIAMAKEMPELVSILDEEDVGRGVIGVGEPPAIPGQSAIANAVFNACGIRLRDLPMTPDKVLMALQELG